MMFILEYTEDGGSCSDFEVQNGIWDSYNSYVSSEITRNKQSNALPTNFIIHTSSENALLAARLLVLNGVIDYNSILFRLNDKDYPLGEFGNILGLPDDFNLFTAKTLKELSISGEDLYPGISVSCNTK